MLAPAFPDAAGEFLNEAPNQPDAAGTGKAEGASNHTPAGWQHSKELILAELVVFAFIFTADWQGLIWFSKTPYLLALGWISLRLRGLGWKDIGWSRYRSWGLTLAIGIASGIAIEAFELFVSGPLLTRLTGKPPDLEDFRPLIGSIKWLLLALAGTWTLAAIGEEFVYRGYLLNRLADLGNRSRAAWIFALLTGSVVFALAHTYQGPTGVIEAGLDGLLLGALYLRCDRKLLLPVIAHGVTDTVDVLLIYLGKYPGV